MSYATTITEDGGAKPRPIDDLPARRCEIALLTNAFARKNPDYVWWTSKKHNPVGRRALLDLRRAGLVRLIKVGPNRMKVESLTKGGGK